MRRLNVNCPMLKPYKQISSRILFTNEYVTYYEDEFIAGNKKTGKYYYESRKNGVMVIGIAENSKSFILIREYKYPIQEFCINAPMGGVNNKEDIEKAARREFLEETGYTSDNKLISLGTWPIYPARTNDRLFTFLLLDCKQITDETGGEETEETEVILVPQLEIWEWITQKLENSNTVLALIRACNYLEIYPNK